MKRKISIFLPFLHDGGVERAMLNLAHGLLDKGHAVDLISATNIEGPFAQQIPMPARTISLNATTPYLALRHLIKYLKKEHPDAIFAALTPANLTAIWARFLARASTRVLVNVQVSVGLAKSTSALKAKLRPSAYHLFYNMADVIVTPSEGVARDLLAFKLERSKVKVIYNPVIPSDLKSRLREYPNHHFFVESGPPIILGAGRLHKQKDFPTLIKAFSLVRKQRPARLLILGEGTERNRLETLVKKLGVERDVDLPGFVKNPFAYMKHSSVFVLSSAWEGFGNVLAEALAVGTPVVSTDCPSGPAEILENGRWGKLVPVGDAEHMAQAILETLEAPPNPLTLQERAKAFSIETATKQYLESVKLL